jgi:hypothetical protein
VLAATDGHQANDIAVIIGDQDHVVLVGCAIDRPADPAEDGVTDGVRVPPRRNADLQPRSQRHRGRPVLPLIGAHEQSEIGHDGMMACTPPANKAATKERAITFAGAERHVTERAPTSPERLRVEIVLGQRLQQHPAGHGKQTDRLRRPSRPATHRDQT